MGIVVPRTTQRFWNLGLVFWTLWTPNGPSGKRSRSLRSFGELLVKCSIRWPTLQVKPAMSNRKLAWNLHSSRWSSGAFHCGRDFRSSWGFLLDLAAIVKPKPGLPRRSACCQEKKVPKSYLRQKVKTDRALSLTLSNPRSIAVCLKFWLGPGQAWPDVQK